MNLIDYYQQQRRVRGHRRDASILDFKNETGDILPQPSPPSPRDNSILDTGHGMLSDDWIVLSSRPPVEPPSHGPSASDFPAEGGIV